MTEPAGFDEFFERTFQGVLASALMLCGHRQDAEDAVQEAYFEALRSWDRVGRYEAPEAWVRKVMRQRLWKASRRANRQIPVGLELTLAVAPQAGPEQTTEARAVIGALNGLPAKTRFVMLMYCLYGASQEEIARELGLARSTVAVYVHTARKLLEKTLGMAPAGQRADEVRFVSTGAAARLPDTMTDPLAVCLRASEQWLCEGLASDEASARHVRAALEQRATRSRSRSRIARFPALRRRSPSEAGGS